MATNFNALNRAASFNPTGPFPLDKRSYFETKADADAAVADAQVAATSSPTSNYYIGQLITVKDNTGTHVYQIGDDKTLHKLDKVSDRESAINALDTSSPSVPTSGTTTATAFIDTVSQTNGKISATKKNLPTASTASAGIVQLNSATNSTSETQAATPKAVKAAYDLAAAALPKSGGTMSGDLTLNTGIIKYGNGDSTDYVVLKCFEGDSNGSGILIGGGGYVGVGSGESASALKDALQSTGGTEDLHLSSDQNIYLHTNCQTIADRKTVTIDATAKITAGSFNANSDARLKENFQPLVPERSILDLPTYKFDFINGSKNQIGCKAQDLQEICPEIVNEGSDGYLSIQESKIVYLLLEEVKKLRKEIDELKGV